MRGVLLASLRRNTRRYVASALAVVIGVAFVVVVNALTNATRDGLTADVGAPYDAVDVVVAPNRTGQAARLVEAAHEADLDVVTVGYAMVPLARDGVQLAEMAAVSEVATDPAVQWQDVASGRFPTRPGEALADVNAAKSTGVVVGDVVTVGGGPGVPEVEVEVVGIADSPAATSAELYVPWEDLHRLEDALWVQAVAWGGTREVAAEVTPGAEIWTKDSWVAAKQAEITRGVDVLAIIGLLFVAIALFVATMVIANTFSILFAQRMREFALLRCVGVTRRQLRRSVRLEALVLGLVSAAVGVATGALAGLGLVRLVRHWYDDMGAASFSLVWVLGAMAVGVLVTLFAAWLPTRVVTQVTPLAALRPDTGVSVRTSLGLLRTGAGLLALMGGSALLAAAMTSHTLPPMLAGGTVVFLGVLLLGPLLVPGMIRLVGRLLGDGPVRRLATGNAVRNPRRTATTAASLLVGVTLTTAVLTGLATSRTAIEVEMDESYPLDSTITATTQPLTTELLDRTRALDGVSEAVAVDGTLARLGDVDLPLLGVDGRASVVRGPDDLVPADGVVHLPYDVMSELGPRLERSVRTRGEVTVVVDGREHVLQVRSDDDGWGRAGLVSAATLAELSGTTEPLALWVRARPGADAEDLRGDLAALAGPVDGGLDGGYGNREYVDLQVDVLTGSVIGLLAIAVLIALIGIANTLGLSVLERARENALLRAMGLTRPQLRRAMATEGLLLSLVATLVGTGLGVAFAWVGIDVMVSPAVGDSSMTLPLGQLALVVLVAAVAGLVACILPARRAGRTAPAAGLALD